MLERLRVLSRHRGPKCFLPHRRRPPANPGRFPDVAGRHDGAPGGTRP
ncbi:hypothetical protein SCOCK_360052 [Actinacidiphila cocklensis]|uniref:Uncharacterized protein n=1 Tax=Actinacidiphila cocklensis TaxID=887465 RepID=A0A9W4GT04_9ACTN|nr:hypothetical protein SCOCK_360052 [Actinacidiphila cocklensis]